MYGGVCSEQLVRRPIGVTDWIQCSNPLCGKWRALSKPTDGSLFTERVRRGMGVRTDQVSSRQPVPASQEASVLLDGRLTCACGLCWVSSGTAG